MQIWKRYRWRLILTGLGLLAAILFMTLGFWRTVLILACCGVGFFIGMQIDKGLHLPQWLHALLDKWS
ncbi:MAG: DUF2273 domain-containing protein [Oscillospiraceae bacterium]|nr:DUF2273 domain-containing protein [Oscillospiraceae bacterium]